MGKLNIEMCDETGITSIFKEDGKKIDIVSDEVNQLRAASGDTQKIKEILAKIDTSFSNELDDEEINQLSSEIK